MARLQLLACAHATQPEVVQEPAEVVSVINGRRKTSSEELEGLNIVLTSTCDIQETGLYTVDS